MKDKKLIYLVSGVILVSVLEILSLLHISFPDKFALALFAVISIAVGHHTIKRGLINLVRLNFKSISALMTLAVIGAFYLHQYPEGAVVIVLFTFGEHLEKTGIIKSRSAIQSLIDTTPKTAFIKNSTEAVPVDDIKVNDILIIKPGDKIPLDGIVTEGNSSVDESAITGEPLPADKQKDSTVYAGTMNLQGYIEMRVTREAKDSTLAKIIALTFSAASSKADSQKFIEKFSSYYVPFIIFSAAALIIIPVFFFHENFDEWLLKSLALLVISCPCALVISTPVSVYSAVGNASRKGLLIKGGKFLEAMGNISAIAFDKTRTLTTGKPVISNIIPYGNYTREDVLSCASGFEKFSGHPIAQSIVTAAEEENLFMHPVNGFISVPGKGVKGTCTICSDPLHSIGSLRFINEGLRVKDEIVKDIEILSSEGKTTVIISGEKEVEGLIALSDEIKPESKAVIAELISMNIKPVMLTGDHNTSAEFTGRILSIEDVRSALLPENKLDAVLSLKESYGKVAMIGDGVNDAPALAAADVGIAMGHGSDAAIETADICLMNNDLSRIPFLIKLSRKTISTIKLNTIFAIAVKIIFISLAAAGLSNLVMAIFADVGVTILVILNSLRLLKFKAI
jgi:Cd2+/Zn2+-exporting ATPase